MAYEMPESGEFPSLDSCKKRFLWTLKKVDLAPHPVVSLVLQAGDGEKFPLALCFGSQGQQAESMFHRNREGWRLQDTCTA